MNGNAIIGGTLRLLTGACGIAAGAVCAYTAYHNGLNMDPGEAGQWFGYGFLAIVCGSWLLWPLAGHMKLLGNDAWATGLKVAWVAAMLFVIGNAIMYTASHRTEAVEGRGLVIDRYTEAKAEKTRLFEELNLLKQNPAWEESKGCTLRIKGGKRLCDSKATLEAKIDAQNAILKAGKPGSKDAGAETLAWVLNADASKVGRAWPIYIAVMLEMMASLMMKLALSPWAPAATAKASPKAKETAEEITEEEAEADGETDALAAVEAMVKANGGKLRIPRRALADKLGMPVSTVHDKLNEWRDAGLLGVEVVNNCTVISLADRRAA